MKRRFLLALALASPATGCSKNAPASATPPMAAGADAALEDDYADPEAEPTGDLGYTEPASFDDLQARLDELDASLSSEGIPAEGAPAIGLTQPEAKRTEDGDRCERICDLKEAICDVAERICGLAEEHEDEEKYTSACTRAQTRCEQATTACETCEG